MTPPAATLHDVRATTERWTGVWNLRPVVYVCVCVEDGGMAKCDRMSLSGLYHTDARRFFLLRTLIYR